MLMLRNSLMATSSLLLALACGAVAAPAAADGDGGPPDCEIDQQTGTCVIVVDNPGGGGGSGGGGSSGGSGGGQSCVWDATRPGVPDKPHPVPCSSDAGYWSNSFDCYVKRTEPQPDGSDPIWNGNYPNGAIYNCWEPPTDLLIMIWSLAPPPNSGAGPTPGQVAQMAVDSMNLRAIDIGIVPKPGRDKMGFVGMPVWMWISDPVGATAGPLTASASAGGITVTATATLDRVEWAMGDGATVTCDGEAARGTAYTAADGRRDSPTCGYRYQKTSGGQPDNAYAVTAASYWVVQWAGAGQTGTIILDPMSSSTQIRVGELQVLEQN